MVVHRRCPLFGVIWRKRAAGPTTGTTNPTLSSVRRMNAASEALSRQIVSLFSPDPVGLMSIPRKRSDGRSPNRRWGT